jgi:hypothetical protein
LSFWGSSKKIVWSFTNEEMGYVSFFTWTLKVFCFHILKFRNIKISTCYFGGL